MAFAAVDLAGKRVTLATFGPLDEIARNVRQDVLLAQQQQNKKAECYRTAGHFSRVTAKSQYFEPIF